MYEEVFERWRKITSPRSYEYQWVAERLLKLPEGIKLLEIGCRSNPHNDQLNPLALFIHGLNRFEMYGVDLGEMTNIPKGYNYTDADACRLPFSGNFFEAVFSVSTIEHVGLFPKPNPQSGTFQRGDLKAVQEIRRVLKPKGQAFITVPYNAAKFTMNAVERHYNDGRLKNLISPLSEVERYIGPPKGGYGPVACLTLRKDAQ